MQLAHAAWPSYPSAFLSTRRVFSPAIMRSLSRGNIGGALLSRASPSRFFASAASSQLRPETSKGV